ncbi:MAG: M3 family metallopeptidase, partial [Thermoguttaceae bacterium]|nr:M3 family metallopeptidase [Thermoguttaceae bacterium]
GTYAHLRLSEDTTNSTAVEMHGRFMQHLTRAEEAASFIRPEILALPDDLLKQYLEAPELAPYRVYLERLVRLKPHTLSLAEERLLAMQTQVAQVPHDVFTQLDCADLTFGTVRDHRGRMVELSHSTFQSLLLSPDRKVRQQAFHQFYAAYEAHRHTLAATLAGSVYTDVYYARARNFPSCLQAALFPEQIPAEVYENLIATVRKFLPALQRYYALRRRVLGLRELRIYDTYVPLARPPRVEYPWDEAVDIVL